MSNLTPLTTFGVLVFLLIVAVAYGYNHPRVIPNHPGILVCGQGTKELFELPYARAEIDDTGRWTLYSTTGQKLLYKQAMTTDCIAFPGAKEKKHEDEEVERPLPSTPQAQLPIIKT